jgi:hypothetical protein
MPSRLVLTALLVSVLPAAAQDRPPAGPVPLAPHRAVYDLSLAASSGSRAVESAQGRLGYDVSGDSCEGFALKYRQVVRLGTGEGAERLSDMTSTTFESADGRTLNFRIETRDEASPSTIDGDAEQGPSGDLRVRLRRPKSETVREAGPVMFPTAHIAALIEAARAGRTSLEVRVFDGSDDGRKVYDTLAVIGRRIEPGAGDLEAPARDPSLMRLPRWPVTLSYYAPGGGERTPTYVVNLELYENGVSRALRLDYGDFSLRGDLTAYEATGTGECRR